MPEKIVYTGRFLELRSRGGWEYVHRVNAADVVFVVAATAAHEIVLVEQERRPLGEAGRRVIELPAGLVGDDGVEDDVCAAARRELIEETGFDAERFAVLSRGPSSAGLTDETVTLVRAWNLQRVGAGGGIANEAITVHCVPVAQAQVWLAEREAAGLLIDPKIWGALYFLAQDPG